MRENGLIRPFRFVTILPVVVCYGLVIAFVAVLSSGVSGRADVAVVFTGLGLTLALASVVCLTATPPALSLAVCFFGMRDARPMRVLYGVLDTVAAVPPIVTAYVVMYAAARVGVAPSHMTACIALLMAFMPRLCTQLTDVLRGVPPQYYLSSAALGARPQSAIWKVVFREARGGIVSSILLMAAGVANEFALLQIALGYSAASGIASAMRDLPPLALLVQQSAVIGDSQTAAMAAIVLLAVDIALSFLTRRMTRLRG